MKLRLSMKLTLLAVSLLAAPLAWADTHTAESADFAGDSRDYTLTVASDHGNPVPGIGTTNLCWRSTVSCLAGSDPAWVCIGWTGTGSIPATGATDATGPLTLTAVASSIAWQWEATEGPSVPAAGPLALVALALAMLWAGKRRMKDER